MRNFQKSGSGQLGRGRVTMAALALTGLAMMVGGCVGPGTTPSVARTVAPREYSPPPLVLASTATLEVLGQGGLASSEMQLFNLRKDFSLGADLPPAMAPVNISQVYIRDQQWIVNGRPLDNYRQTTRSLQMRSR
jgi:hypothetical protein